jgi:ethanolamine permease
MQLARTLTPMMIWGLGVGYVISGSYFGWNLGLPYGGTMGMLIATVLVTVLYVTFVLGYAELSCALPKAGGAFVYVQRAFGEKAGFVVGAAQLVEYVLAPPAIAFAIGSYVNQAKPELPILGVALAAYVVFTIINMVGMKASVTFELVITVLAVIELLVFAAVALPHFSWEKFSADPLPQGPYGIVAALPFAMWFYLAIEGIANVAEEAKNPQRDLPRGFLLAMGTLVILTTLVFFGSVGVDGWRSVVFPTPGSDVTSDSPLPLAVAHVVGRESALFTVLTGVGLLGLIASFHGILIAASRALLAFGQAGFAPRALGVVHPKLQTPVMALVVNAMVGALALLTGRTGDIITLAVFGAVTLYISSTLALLKLRTTEPLLDRPYRAPLYPWVPLVALVLGVIVMVAMILSTPMLFGVYVAMLATAYAAWRMFGVRPST